MPEKSVSQNIQNIFFVLKIRKNTFLPGAAAGGAGALLTGFTIVTTRNTHTEKKTREIPKNKTKHGA